MSYKIDVDKNRRIFIVPNEGGSATKVFQTRKRNGLWVWNGTEKINTLDMEELLVSNGKICPECKTDTDERGRCLAQCHKRYDLIPC